MKLTYTPYDGSSQPFTIGLQQLDPDRWIEPDANLADQLAEKQQILDQYGDLAFRAEPGTEAAQQEVLDALADYLPEHHPALYRRDGERMQVASKTVNLGDDGTAALQRAGLLVQDDLVIMRKGDAGWRIAAAFLAFPSSWSLAEKFGKVMGEVHAPVPDFQAGSRNAGLIERMFDNLSPDRFVVRWNWSVNWRHALYHPLPASNHERTVAPAEDAIIRVERQTLRKLPLSGDILFTIRIYLDPVRAIMAQPNATELALSLADQLERLSFEQAGYKGMLERRAELMDLLRRKAETPDPAKFSL